MSQSYALTTFITSILAGSLGALVVWKKPGSAAARMWAAMCFFVAGWALVNTLSLLSQTAAESVKYLRIADGFALFIPITFLHFAMLFSERIKPRALFASYLTTGLLALTIPTSLFVREGQKKFGIWFEVGGPAFLLFSVLFILLPAYGIFLLYQTARVSNGPRRAQLFSVILASSLGFGGGFMWFPPAFGINIPPLGGHLVALYCVVIAYAILRYQFLDIQFVIRRSLVYSLLITVLTIGYFGLLYGIERILKSAFGYQSLGVSLTAFALMALLFQPLKIGIQRLVDRVIFGVPQEALVRRLERLEETAVESEKFKAVSTLAAGMAHEIKNPLTALRAFAESIPEKYGDPEFAGKLHQVLLTETERIQTIVQDLLSFAKPKPPKPKPIDPQSLLSSTVDLLSNELQRRNIHWELHFNHNGCRLHADPDQLRQVLINLIQNAADAMPQGGTLSLSTRSDEHHLELTVSDTGCGIPKGMLPKIFDPFVSTKSDGNGLGLSIVRSIIQAHHGTIRAESQHGKGTTFTVSLPL